MTIHRPVAFFATLFIGFMLTVGLIIAVPSSDSAVGDEPGPNSKVVAWFYPEMNKKATLVTRIIDCEAGVVCWIANSHTYGFAVGDSCLPIKDTLLIYKEVCSGTETDK